MGYYFERSLSEMYQEKYTDLLLRHYKELNLPYPFPIAFSYLASPILMEGEAILCFNDEEDEPAGAIGIIYGTGEHQYKDTHVAQIQAFFIVERHRQTHLFQEGLRHIVSLLADRRDPVSEIRFWIPAQDQLRKLCGKFAERTTSSETEYGMIDEYRTALTRLTAYFERSGRTPNLSH